MKLRNKKTGEIVDVESLGHADSLKGKFGYQVTLSWKIDEHLDTCKTYNSLAELNEEWEDYDDTKDHWCITFYGEAKQIGKYANSDEIAQCKQIGNYFETKEEAEKAVEKLKAWKRLEDKGFSFHGYDDGYKHDFNSGHIEFYVKNSGDVLEDLDLLFSGEDD